MIARRVGTLVSLGMMFGAISGCGSQLDPRLQVNAELRAECNRQGSLYSEEKIRNVLALVEERRLQGATKDEQFEEASSYCNQQYQKYEDDVQCLDCEFACVAQVYRFF